MHMQLHYYFTVKVWGEDKCSKLKQYMTSSYIGPNVVIIESIYDYEWIEQYYYVFQNVVHNYITMPHISFFL